MFLYSNFPGYDSMAKVRVKELSNRERGAVGVFEVLKPAAWPVGDNVRDKDSLSCSAGTLSVDVPFPSNLIEKGRDLQRHMGRGV